MVLHLPVGRDRQATVGRSSARGSHPARETLSGADRVPVSSRTYVWFATGAAVASVFAAAAVLAVLSLRGPSTAYLDRQSGAVLADEKVRTEIRDMRAAQRRTAWSTLGIIAGAAVTIAGGVVGVVKLFDDRARTREDRRAAELHRFDETYRAAAAEIVTERHEAGAISALVGFLRPEESARVHRQTYLLLLSELKVPDRPERVHRLLLEAFEQAARLVLRGLPDGDHRLALDFVGADLAGAALRSYELAGADLTRARLGGADLSRSCLWHANLEGVSARGLVARYANLEGARLGLVPRRRYRAPGAARRSVLTRADFTGANLVNAGMQHARLAAATFRNARLQGAHLDGADLQGARFEGANVRGATFAGAVLDDSARRSLLAARNWERIRDDDLVAALDAMRAPRPKPPRRPRHGDTAEPNYRRHPRHVVTLPPVHEGRHPHGRGGAERPRRARRPTLDRTPA